MIQNYLKSAFRILIKERLYTLINAFGLSVALAACFHIYAWVTYELSFDKHFADHERIYRVATITRESAEPGMASTYPMVRTRILSQLPEIEASTRLFDAGLFGTKTKVTFEDKIFTDNDFFYADSTFFNVFKVKFLRGDQTALQKPNALVLTEETARKYFGSDDPIGKSLTMGENSVFEVTAVIENIPSATHFHFDMLASMQSHPWIKNAEQNVWSGVVFHTYAKLKPGANAQALESKASDILDHFPNDPKGFGKQVGLQLQPLDDIHLQSNLQFEFESNGSGTYVMLFTTVAILVLIVAMINYTNLSMARLTQRFKEVAVRKVLGASVRQLTMQFMTEAVLIVLLSAILAVILSLLIGPMSNDFANPLLLTELLHDSSVLLGAGAIVVLIVLVTGLSPSLALSVLKPVLLLKGNQSATDGRITIRMILVVTQFTVSIALTICTAIVYSQVKYIQTAALGYDKDHIIVLNIGFPELKSRYTTLKTELLNNPSVLGATASSSLPTDIQTGENIDVTPSQSTGVYYASVDADFFRVLNIPFRQGQDLIESIKPNDSINHFVLTEGAMKAIGWNIQDATGKQISIRHGNQRPGNVLGIVGDFHFQSFHHALQPLVLEFNPKEYEYLLLKIKGDHVEETIQSIANTWDKFAEGIPFEYQFLNQSYDHLYQSERRSGNLFIAFSIVALLISVLGLFGLSSFSVERRTREIGIRKILGAETGQILLMISKDFVLLLGLAFLLALPIGYYFMNTWLSGFAYKTRIGPLLFVVAGMVNVILALVTLSYHSLKISATDPVKTLKTE